MSDPSERPESERPSEQSSERRAARRADASRVDSPQVDSPSVEAPRPEVAHPADTARVPGAPRDGYTRMPTGPVGLAPTIASGPADTAGTPTVPWTPAAEPIVEDNARLAPWALVAAIVALVASWFVGWGIPLAIIAVIAAIMSLRRPVESRSLATWALVLGLAATVFSLGWLIWAAMQFEQMG
ncbi:MAG: hypothetical protein ACTIKT_15810 [Microbacterium sp.]